MSLNRMRIAFDKMQYIKCCRAIYLRRNGSRGKGGMNIRLAFLGFDDTCARLAGALSSLEGVEVVGLLGKKVPEGWPASLKPPVLYGSRAKLLREGKPDLLLLAEGAGEPKNLPENCQVLDLREKVPLVEFVTMLSAKLEENQRLRQNLSEVTSICASVNVVEAYSDPVPKLSQLLDRALAFSGDGVGMVLMPGEEVDSLRVVLARGDGIEGMVGKSLSIANSLCGRAFDGGVIVQREIGPDMEEFDYLRDAPVKRLLAMPMRAEGRVVGVIALGFTRDIFNANTMPVLTLLADQAGLAVLIARLYSELETNVVKDTVSGLYNANYFQQRLHEEICRARRYSLNVCLVFLEIDDFAGYVERNGRFMGDFVLSDVGSIITRNTREVDTAARFGDHVFALLLPETRRLGAMRLAERIRKVMEEYPFPSRERKEVETLTMCAGVASYPANADNEQDLVKRALSALAAAKKEGPNSLCLFSEELAVESG